MASLEARALVYSRLWLWRDYLTHGYLPGQGDGIPSGSRPGSRLPCPVWLLDLSRAFAALNPATSGLADDGRIAWLLHAPFTPQQEVVWAYYAGGRPPDTRRADAQFYQHDRDRELTKAVKSAGRARDERVAAALGLSAHAARILRYSAVSAMADFVRWDEDDSGGRG